MANKPKILLFDIETSPIIGYSWGIWEQNIIKVIKPWHLLCFAYKWLDDKKIHTVALPDFKAEYVADKDNDFMVTAALRQILDEADIVVAHNGDAFDIRKALARIAYHQLPPPSPFVSIDTKKIAKSNFSFDSNSLKSLAEFFDVEKKMDTGGFQLWEDCMAGDLKAWKKMITYNKQDVAVLEDIYKKLRPFIKTHPVVSEYHSEACAKCGSENTQRRGQVITKSGMRYQRYQCMDCGGWKQSHLKI